LFLWLGLMVRAIWPAFKKPGENKHMLALFLVASSAIAIFWAAGLMWDRQTHLAMAEYWRWWVVHLWVEGFFEVFATAVISLLFVKLGLVRAQTANGAVLFGTIVFLFGGVLGTAHHWYFAGTPVSVIAIGSTFSALEVVPLALIGAEAFETWRHSRAAPWVQTYKWPIMFFVAVAFWNLLGAGVFGFMINPPISLYFIQGLNTTATHAHSALFGVYGMLGIGLMLFCFRGLARREAWSDRLLAWTFWLLNGGLAAMVFLSLLPVGVIQAIASIEHGMWFARSPEVIHSPIVETLVWMRVPGDILFGMGAFTLAAFAAKLVIGSMKPRAPKLPEAVPQAAE
ncbi:MAG TPA: cbb3-type cytochrome c oxidase subunit I, partial [Caulobacteraceae bacterium]|nr:cbb3-type cytochrome c oxidase subunit I [Caulobacteraceae bacterium]